MRRSRIEIIVKNGDKSGFVTDQEIVPCRIGPVAPDHTELRIGRNSVVDRGNSNGLIQSLDVHFSLYA